MTRELLIIVLPRYKMHKYQERAVEHVVNLARSMLRLEMSLGKTVSVLTAIVQLLDTLQIRGALVVAPRRVVELIWKQEAEKWLHTAHLRVCILRGKSKDRLAQDLIRPFDVWVINYEALAWLASEINRLFLSRKRYPPFDMLVLDEITRIKNIKGARVANLYAANAAGIRLIDYFPRRVGLTGTIAPNGYFDLFGQFYAIDDGVALGRDEAIFTERYFSVNPFTGHKSLQHGARQAIQKRIVPIVLSMCAEDYIRLPKYVINDLWVNLPDKVRKQYNDFEATMFAELDHGTLEVFNEVSVIAKCRQLANGMIIDTDAGIWSAVHDAKLEALDEIVEEAGGSPLLVSYVFRPDMKRIVKRYEKRLRIGYLGPGVSDAKAPAVYEAWNQKKYDLLLINHQSGGHGLNLQAGGHQIVWFGLDWPLDGYLQLCARLRRQGQKSDYVIVHRILAADTVDEAVKERLEAKEKDQDDLTSAIQALQSYHHRKG